MRIVGGRLRGRQLQAPVGSGTRPTTDRMRESIASMVLSAQGLDLSDASVLDAFAGSGAVGFELVSRGARRCTLCDRDRRAAAVLRQNCKSLGLGADEAGVVVGDMRKLAGARLAGSPFEVVFLDPPYAMEASEVAGIVETLFEAGQLLSDALVVYERSATAPTLELGCAQPLRSRKHGGTCIDLFRIGEQP